MECKNCGTLLEEGVTLCPSCGTENAEEPALEAAPETVTEETEEVAVEVVGEDVVEPAAETPAPINKTKLAMLLLGGFVAGAVVICLILAAFGVFKKGTPAPTEPTSPVTTNATDATETVAPATEPSVFVPTMSDEEAAEAMAKVVGSCGDISLTNGQISAAYWMTYYEFGSQLYNYYGLDPSYFGLDTSKPLSEQECYMGEEGLTWQDYFLDQALQSWSSYLAMTQACKELNLTLDPQDQAQLDALDQSLAQSAAQYGFSSPDEMLRNDFGAGVTLDDYKSFLEGMLMANRFYAYQAENLELTDEDVEAYYDEHVEDFALAGIEKNDSPSAISVRHILITPEGEQENGAYTDEQMDAARAIAQEILDGWAAGEATEDSFAALAGEHSQDPGSVNNGGLYTGVTPGQMVPTFNDWCFDPARRPGDTGLVDTSYGIHIMYFSAVEDATPYWLGTVREELTNNRLSALADEAIAAHPAEIDRAAIILSEVDIANAY